MYGRMFYSNVACKNYRLLNLYCEIFGTSSYGEGRTSLTPCNMRKILHGYFSAK